MTPRNVLLFLLALLGLGALGGSAVMRVSPSGQLLGMRLSMLGGSPFHSSLIPGFILFTELGVVPCLLVVALLKKPASPVAERLNFFTSLHWAWTGSTYVAFALIIWIQFEMVLLHAVSRLHTAHMGWTLAILLVALLPKIRTLHKKTEAAST